MWRLLNYLKKLVRRSERKFLIVLSVFIWSFLVLLLLCLFVAKVVDWVTLLEAIFGLLLAMLPLYLYLLKRKEQTVLMAYTSRFLLRGEEGKIDELLGILIAGKLQRIKIDPLDEFFETLKDLCVSSSVEMRRRIAEALPALFKIDTERAEDLVEILRNDWDERWKADNRRRTVEALSHIVKSDPNFVLKNLTVFDRDEAYTIIACVELIHLWQEADRYFRGDLVVRTLMSDMRSRGFGNEELEAIEEFWRLLSTLRSDKLAGKRIFNELKTTKNTYIQICLARSIRRFCGDHFRCFRKGICNGFPEFVLDQMEFFLAEDKDRNVRRPMAKEDSLDCLVILLRYETHAQKAKSMIRRLVKDSDNIIKITAFDKIENILDVDMNFGRDVVEEVLLTATHPKLVERAQIIKERLESNR